MTEYILMGVVNDKHSTNQNMLYISVPLRTAFSQSTPCMAIWNVFISLEGVIEGAEHLFMILRENKNQSLITE